MLKNATCYNMGDDAKACDLSIHSIPKEYQSLDFRQNLASEWISENCKKCIDLENNNQKSQRYYLNSRFENELEDYIYFDIRFSSVCNLVCVGCSEQYSSSWAKLKGLSVRKKQNKDQAIENIVSEVKKTDKNILLYFAGGEPFLIKEHFHLIAKVREVLSNDQILKLQFLTNLTRLNDEVLDLAKSYEIILGISIDSWGEANQYLRYPCNNDEIINNIVNLHTLGIRRLYFQPTVSLLNIFHLREFLNLSKIIRDRLKEKVMYYPHLLVDPVELSIFNTPKNLRAFILEEITHLKNAFKNISEFKYFYDLLISIEANLAVNSSALELPEILKYIERKDEERNLKYEISLPELKKIIDKVYNE